MSSQRADTKRILILIHGLGLGGAERLIADAAPLWDRSSFDYSIAYVLPWKDQLVGAIEATGSPVVCVGGKRGLDPGTRTRLRSLIRETQSDLIHAHLPSAGILARMSTTRPVVYTEHNLADSYRQPTRTLNRLTYGRNRAVIAVSQAVAESISTYPGPPPVVIANGVSMEMPSGVAEVRGELGIENNAPLIVHVGNIRPHKGHTNLIAATAILANELPDVNVVSIGGEKAVGDLERVREEAEAAGAAENIRFLGRRNDARRFLAAADVVVNPSDVEGLPVMLLEALLLSRPVVATDVGGVSQVIVHEQTGLLVPARDPGALAMALARCLRDPAATEWGEAGERLVAERHSLADMVRRYEQLYRLVLDV